MYFKLLSVCLFSAAIANAQPTITSSSVASPGNDFTVYAANPQSEGAAGANITWDFSGIGSTSSGTTAYITCAAAPSCANFPGTNLVQNSSSNYVYYIKSATALSIKGSKTTGEIPLTNPEDIIRFPFTLNSTYVDSLGGTFTSGSPLERKGTVTVTGDGYGTLKLPTGVFHDVLRVKRVEVYDDRTVPGGAILFSYVITTYGWYSPYHQEVLLGIIHTTVNGNPFPDRLGYTGQFPLYTKNEFLASEATLNVYPSPAKGNINLQLFTPVSGLVSYNVSDMAGRVIYNDKQEATTGQNEWKLNTDDWAPGLYLVHLNIGQKSITQKIKII